MVKVGNRFDKDYFESGLVKGVSCYQDYRWIPELTIPFAHYLIRHIDLPEGSLVLDFGAAKGFLVKALRLLGIKAYGYDISDYALSTCDNTIREYMYSQFPVASHYDWLISKDVLEHLTEDQLAEHLELTRKVTSNCFHIIPLGTGSKFIVPSNNLDSTHILAKSHSWWSDFFYGHGWMITRVDFYVLGMKEHHKEYSQGTGFFRLQAR